MVFLQIRDSLLRLPLLTLSAYIYGGLLQFFDPLKKNRQLASGCSVILFPDPTEPSDQQSIQAEAYPNDNRFYTRIRNPAYDPGSDNGSNECQQKPNGAGTQLSDRFPRLQMLGV